MGSSPAPSPQIVYAPAPPPPGPPTQVPTQSFQTQTALNEISGAQARLNMNLGAQLDQQNKEFFTTQDIRQAQAIGGEARATLAAQGIQERASTLARGEQERLGIATTGEQQRLTLGTSGEQERLTLGTKGEQERLGIAATGLQQRKTLLQQQMQDNYVAQRNYDWAQQAYRVASPTSTQRPTSAPPDLIK